MKDILNKDNQEVNIKNSSILKETNHDYQNCLVGNPYNRDLNGTMDSWSCFKKQYTAFTSSGFDDTYHFVFRYDIHKKENDCYLLELCIMFQRKGYYSHLYIDNISNEELNGEVKDWLKGRLDYIKSLWREVMVD